jgi:hypothetical protein
MDDPDSWANLGQGAPEVEDDIEGCFERPHSIEVTMGGREYGPTAGRDLNRDSLNEKSAC